MSELHDKKTEPMARRKFDSSFEKEFTDGKIKKSKLQKLMFDQCLVFSYELAMLDKDFVRASRSAASKGSGSRR